MPASARSDDIALVPQSSSAAEPIDTTVQTCDGTVTCVGSRDLGSRRKRLLAKYRRAPISFFQIICLGCVLLSLIVACVVVETLRSARSQSDMTVHTDADREYHEALVQRINDDGNATWKAEYNPNAEMADPEPDNEDSLEQTRTYLRTKQLSDRQLLQDTQAHLKTLVQAKITLPPNFDSRLRWPQCWSVHQVPNQGGCGSCWAMAATSAMSDRLCIATNGSLQAQLSAQDLSSCCSLCGGCQGTHWALSSFTHWKERGLVTGGFFGTHEGCKPYEVEPVCGSPCSSNSYSAERTPQCVQRCRPRHHKNYNEDLIHSRTAYWLRAERGSSEATPIVGKTIRSYVQGNDIEILKKEIYLNGPVLACFTVQEEFQHYSHGIYQSTTIASPRALYGHCAKLLGWGVDAGREYWLYMNTWGREWGENGFFRVAIADIPEEAVAGIYES